MVIAFNKFFSFFSMALLGMEEMRVVDYDGQLDEKSVPGVYVDDDSLRMRRVRNVGDILQHSVRKYFGVDPEVDAWVEKMGGMAQVDEALVGRDKLREYVHDMRAIKAETGFAPTILGNRHLTEGVESATDYDSYAVTAHRELSVQKMHGVIEEDQRTDPSWEGHESNIGSTWEGGAQRIIRPFWWNKIFMGMFRVGQRSDGSHGLKQLETSSGKDWVLDIRVSKEMGGLPFHHITEYASIPEMGAWSEMEDNQVVKELINRFYNNPSSLTWKKVGTGSKERWAAGMITPQGSWIWTPLTHPSSKTMDWWRNNEGSSGEKFYCRALYLGEWIIAYRKAAKADHINVRKFKACDQTGWLAKWKDVDMHYYEWNDLKKALLSRGATDAYFGKPGKKAEYKKPAKKLAPL
tara:strand:- start:42434 stop:43654 length:1221 start_codon:yes stop_codon:yes gene_type:complete